MTSLDKKAYERKRKKKAKQNDRMSELPVNVIDAILANLELRDQVRTSILSKNWRYMWTLVPQICIDQFFFEWFSDVDDCDSVVSKIITRVLRRHNGPIHKFTLFIPIDSGFKITVEYLNRWIPYLSNDVKYLYLVNWDYPLPDEMPHVVFSCKELTYFKFGGFNLSVPPHFCGFKRLLELYFDSVNFQSGALESLLSGCPILEKLTIEPGDTRCDNLVISSPSLKVFVLILMVNMKSISLKRAKNLIDFTLHSQHSNLPCSIKGFPKKLKRLSLFRGEKNSLPDIIPPKLLTSSLSSLEYLKLDDMNLSEKGELLYLVSVLKSAPRLIELAIIQDYNMVDTSQVSDLSEELKCPSCCCLKLQTVNIDIVASSQHVMSLIKFILANSTQLKTLTLNCSYNKFTADMLFRISQDLLLMERASPRAQVKFSRSVSVVS